MNLSCLLKIAISSEFESSSKLQTRACCASSNCDTNQHPYSVSTFLVATFERLAQRVTITLYAPSRFKIHLLRSISTLHTLVASSSSTILL